MNYLSDTNVLLRLVQTLSLHHTEAKNAVDKSLKRGDTLFITFQNASEFWNPCTRPTDTNGLGLTIVQADAELSKIEQVFDLLPDTEKVYRNRRKIVVNHSVSGIQFHDAKIAAAMKAYSIQNLLTFNTEDLKRYTDIKAVEPKDV